VELGVVSQGKTIEAAQANLKEAVELYLADEPRILVRTPQHAPLVTMLQVAHA